MSTPARLDRTARAQLAEALASAEDAAAACCSFFACPGPDRPMVPMGTCHVCRTVQLLRRALARLGVDGAPARRPATAPPGSGCLTLPGPPPRKSRPGTGALGMRNGNVRFTPQQVEDIRRRWRDGETQESIARSLGIRQGTVSNLIHRRLG